MAKARRYYVDMDSDVTAISLVEEGAIMSDFIALAKQQPKQVYLEKEEKHLVVGAILIPERPIYRYDAEWGDYYITFSQQVIEKLAYDYMKNKLTDSVTLDHETNANNITLVESWIRTSENDKSVDLGLDAPIGSWIGAMKIEDDETWQRIKSQELNGFSVEAFCNLNEFKNTMTNMMNEDKKSLLEEIKELIQEAFSVASKPQELEKEEVVEENLSVEEEVTEEVIEENLSVEEEVPTEEKVEEELEAEVPTEEVVEEPKEEEIDLQSVINALQEELESIKAENEELKKQNEKLSKQPSVKKLDVKANSEKTHPSFLDFASGRLKY